MAKNLFAKMWLRFSLSRFGRFLHFENLPSEIAENEQFTRFLVHSNQFRTGNGGRVMPSALLPLNNKKRARWETSTHRTDGLSQLDVWRLGYRFVENVANNRRIKARGSGSVATVLAQALQFDVNGRPYPRHADIIGWPDDKHARMMQATQIANRLILENDPRPG